MDGAIRRSDIRCISIRPSWVQHEGNYERNLGPMLRDRSELSAGFWSYIDVYDLADAMVLAAESDLPGHEVFYIASPDNVGGRPSVMRARTTGTDRGRNTPTPRDAQDSIKKASACSATSNVLARPRRRWPPRPGVEGLCG